MARLLNLPDYRAFVWKAFERTDNSPADALAFHEWSAAHIVPLFAQQMAARRNALAVPTVRPYDLDAPLDTLPPLRPFADVPDFIDKSARMFDALSPDYGAY